MGSSCHFLKTTSGHRIGCPVGFICILGFSAAFILHLALRYLSDSPSSRSGLKRATKPDVVARKRGRAEQKRPEEAYTERAVPVAAA